MYELSKTDYKIIDGGKFITDKKWIMPKRTFDVYEMLFVNSGEIYLTDGADKFELTQGDLLVIVPQRTYYGYRYSDGNTEFSWICVNFSCPVSLSGIIKNFSGGELIAQILHEISLPEINEDICDGTFKHLFAVLNSVEMLCNIPNIQFCDDIVEWIRKNADATLTVKEVAGHFDYNSEYLSRIFRKRFNVGIKSVIDSCIIKRAKDYLLMSDYSIREISELLKFSSPSLFTNFYKYHEKTVPHSLRDNKFR